MSFQVSRVAFEVIAPLRNLYRHEANCQIVRDSILGRGLADSFEVRSDGGVVGYAGVWNEHFEGRLMEFFVLPRFRSESSTIFKAALKASGANSIEAQTNVLHMVSLLRGHGRDIVVENLLFEEGGAVDLAVSGAEFRRRRPEDGGPDGDWVVELGGAVVGAGDVLRHYNPPFGDIYMAVVPEARRMGIGSLLVQELRRVSYEAGRVPAARCDPGNEASRRALIKGGLVECGQLLAGVVD